MFDGGPQTSAPAQRTASGTSLGDRGPAAPPAGRPSREHATPAPAAVALPPSGPARQGSPLQRAQAASLLRHALSVIGGILIGRGVLTSAEAVALGGVILPAASVGWSLWERWTSHRDADRARNLPPGSRELAAPAPPSP